MGTRAEYISKNLGTIKELVRMGEVSPRTMTDFKVFCFFNSLSGKIMDRYSLTAEEMKMNERSVRLSVARMKQKV